MINRIPCDTIDRSTVSGQSRYRQFSFNMPYVYFIVCDKDIEIAIITIMKYNLTHKNAFFVLHLPSLPDATKS